MKTGQRGFTFIEIMVVVVILGILAGLVIPRLIGRAEEARVTKAAVQIREIINALELYRLDNSIYPSTEQGLKALVEEPTTEPEPKKWKQYMDRIPDDPWGNDYIYICPGNHGPFDLYSLGADGEESDDDIQSWNLPD
ncbi:MAG: type II secretion system major pseudopilin GspG [Candidatus Eremiobacteraeota bacterium]|nr:type II secretion system major pseudopilin GspG [Candidatus Eremiobacteraeota bacterium]